MNESEVIKIVEGYVNYFNFMHRTKLIFYLNHHLKEIEIREKSKKNKKNIIYFYYGDVKHGLKVRIFFHNENINIVNKFKNKYGESVIDQKFIIQSLDKLHTLFQTIEESNIFKKK
jgi:hypothetical protein